MSKLYVLYFVTYYAVCIQQSLAVSLDYLPPSTCKEPQSKNINWLADIINKFKKVPMCDFKTDAKAIVDNEGRWIISYRVNTVIKNDLEAEQLCECMRKFIFQSDWTDGAIHICKNECTSLTFFVIAARNPDLIGIKSVTNTCEPLKTLAEGLNRFPDVQVGGKNCITTTGRTPTGQIRVTSECDNDPEPQKICDIIYDLFNAEDWLDSTTDHECYVKNNKLYLEIVEKADVGYCY